MEPSQYLFDAHALLLPYLSRNRKNEITLTEEAFFKAQGDEVIGDLVIGFNDYRVGLNATFGINLFNKGSYKSDSVYQKIKPSSSDIEKTIGLILGIDAIMKSIIKAEDDLYARMQSRRVTSEVKVKVDVDALIMERDALLVERDSLLQQLAISKSLEGVKDLGFSEEEVIKETTSIPDDLINL